MSPLIRSLLRRPAIRAALALGALAATPGLHASSITYNVALTPSYGKYGGSGTITLASAPAAYGVSLFSQASGQLQDLTFTLDDQTFSLAGDPWATVEFVDGQLYNISFSETIGSSPQRFTLDTSSVYNFYRSNGDKESSGSITASPAFLLPEDSSDTETSMTSAPASPTPEPGSLLLLATALLGGGFLVVRRGRTANS